MSLRNEVVEASRYESGVKFDLIKVPLEDGSSCWDIDILTSMSYVRLSMLDEKSARWFYRYLVESEEIVEVSTDDELPDPDPKGKSWGPVDMLKNK
jgi:hypothetical protein